MKHLSPLFPSTQFSWQATSIIMEPTQASTYIDISDAYYRTFRTYLEVDMWWKNEAPHACLPASTVTSSWTVPTPSVNIYFSSYKYFSQQIYSYCSYFLFHFKLGTKYGLFIALDRFLLNLNILIGMSLFFFHICFEDNGSFVPKLSIILILLIALLC